MGVGEKWKLLREDEGEDTALRLHTPHNKKMSDCKFHDEDREKPVWRIIWMMTHNGYSGYRDSFMTYKYAKDIATKMNVKYGNEMSHWVQHKNEPLPEN